MFAFLLFCSVFSMPSVWSSHIAVAIYQWGIRGLWKELTFHYSSSPPSVVVVTSPLGSPSAVCLGFVPCSLPLCQSYFFLIYAWVVAMAQHGVPCFIIPFLSFSNMLWSDWGSPNSTFIPGISTVTLLRRRKDTQMSPKSSLASVAMALLSIEIK